MKHYLVEIVLGLLLGIAAMKWHIERTDRVKFERQWEASQEALKKVDLLRMESNRLLDECERRHANLIRKVNGPGNPYLDPIQHIEDQREAIRSLKVELEESKKELRDLQSKVDFLKGIFSK